MLYNARGIRRAAARALTAGEPMMGVHMNQTAPGIVDQSPSGISEQERRWAILRWLSAKLHDTPHSDILDAANQFENFVAGQVAGQKLSKEAVSEIERIEPVASKIIAQAAEVDADLEAMDPPEWMDRR